MVSAVAITLLVVSHLAGVPALLTTINYKGFFNPIDFVLVLWSLIISLMYHLTQVEVLNYTSVLSLEEADNVMQFITLTWFTISEMGFPFNVTVSLLFTFVAMYTLMANYLVFSYALPIAAMLMIAFLFAVRSLLYRMPVRHFSTQLLFIFGVLASVGITLFIIGSSPGTEHYEWAHGVWHIFAYLGLFVFLILRYDPELRITWNMPTELDLVIMARKGVTDWKKILKKMVEKELPNGRI